MEIIGKIIQVLEARGGTSARTGTPWKVQSYVLETEEQYPKRMVFEVFGEDKINVMNIQVGQNLKVSFDIDAHEYQGRWYNQIRAWKVEPPVAEAPAAQPGFAPQGDGSFAPQAAPAAPMPQAPAPSFDNNNGAPFSEEESTNDLPF